MNVNDEFVLQILKVLQIIFTDIDTKTQFLQKQLPLLQSIQELVQGINNEDRNNNYPPFSRLQELIQLTTSLLPNNS